MLFSSIRKNTERDFCRPEVAALVPTSATTILDVGCAFGGLGKLLKENNNRSVWGIEADSHKAQCSSKVLDKCFHQRAEHFCEPGLREFFDTIIFSDILEHLEDPWHTLSALSQYLKPDGVVIASIPNITHEAIRARLSLGLFSYEPFGIMDISHLRHFSYTSIFQLFAHANLKIINISPHPSKENPIQYLITAIKALNSRSENSTTIIIPTIDNLAYLKQTIVSIRVTTHEPYGIIVVANGSNEETIVWLRQQNDILTIENNHALGFPIAINLALGSANTDYYVIANDDLIFTEGWLTNLIATKEQNKKAGIIGPLTNRISGPQQIDTPQFKTQEEMQAYATAHTVRTKGEVARYPRIVFFCALITLEVINKIGLLDEIFTPGNFEDDDYCLRALHAGFTCLIDKSTFIYHHCSTTWKKDPEYFKSILKRNQELFLLKWGSNPLKGFFPTSI